MILGSRRSDCKLERRYYVAVSLLLGGIAFISLRGIHSPLVTVVLLACLAIGYCSSLSPFWALPGEFLTGFSAASGIALINSVGNLGGFTGSAGGGVFRPKKSHPRWGPPVSGGFPPLSRGP